MTLLEWSWQKALQSASVSVFQDPGPEYCSALFGDLKVALVTGLRADSKLSRGQWRAREAEIALGMPVLRTEADPFVYVCKTLGEKKQFEQQAVTMGKPS
ncbi:hypothetical protein PAAG_12187 [Paracoccidioides lutzii Pb01]|uniref:Uncharacterized protein n=1 Tax=Paracoccidioides lutzii (strain ATCC MYA-826 / Pb01) TaxID=502779 RepID=A0A0A2VJW1_PARBA|nr:hypothetical protein PAAG_12187 [Paracoccidioides lutzii Pb01]KGQ01149.1 hypothetical protein PAAG_12187 [Paracoccidioides lutzii Pb01]